MSVYNKLSKLFEMRPDIHSIEITKYDLVVYFVDPDDPDRYDLKSEPFPLQSLDSKKFLRKRLQKIFGPWY